MLFACEYQYLKFQGIAYFSSECTSPFLSLDACGRAIKELKGFQYF